MKLSYSHTFYASYLGYITQAITLNLATLFFVIFQIDYSVSFEQLSLIITINFVGQMIIDALSPKIIPKIGVRRAIVFAHISASLGLVLLTILPDVINAYAGILIATLFMSIGGGFTEVLISPIVNSIPGEGKSMKMSFLHSFYSWGLVLVVLGTTMFLKLFGHNNWKFVPVIWAIIPFLNIFYFAVVPLPKDIVEEKEKKLADLFTSKMFLIFMFIMICGGAAEMGMSQWASLFAETGLGVSKATGDLLGPCAFAALMGLTRVIYSLTGNKINLKKALMVSAFLCTCSYILVVFAPSPIISLLSCAFCGMTVGLMWPGVLSLSAEYYPQGGSAMFAILALAGDIGCVLGPSIIGTVSGYVQRNVNVISTSLISAQSNQELALKIGILIASIFPLAMLLRLIFLKKLNKL